MAGRRPGYRHSEETRAKIKASALINRLHQVAMGEVDAVPAQVNAAKALLSKVLPDLKSTELTGQGGGPLRHQAITRTVIDPEHGDNA